MMSFQFTLLYLLTNTAVAAAPDRKPNFVVFFCDDLGYGDTGFNGNPTTHTPYLDELAWSGKILTSWYSGCNVCTGSRASLMTGRQMPRTGLPGVIGPDCSYGLNLQEITIAEHLKQHANYSTAIVGKWHLGSRKVYLPGNRGFDHYLGIPFSDDMGQGWMSECPGMDGLQQQSNKSATKMAEAWPSRGMYDALGLLDAKGKPTAEQSTDEGTKWLPLVHQKFNKTAILEQPVDLATLASKYTDFATNFVKDHKDSPFFLYIPFSHVHTTASKTFEKQYAGCDFQNKSTRGPFGDALSELDWMAGQIVKTIRDLDMEEDTLFIFTSDNGPWMAQGLSGGSEGLFTGRFALGDGYWNTGKGSNWEGGIREPAFAYWKGKITPFSRSAEVVSSLDVFPTLSSLAGIPMPTDRPFDGRDMSDVLLIDDGKSQHDFLFFYGTCNDGPYWGLTGVRHGKYKAHWCTAPGLGHFNSSSTKKYDPPLLFDVDKDPSEAEPISFNKMPTKEEDLAAMQRILAAYANEKATFQFGIIKQEPDGEDEGPGRYALCCDRSRDCYCKGENNGILNLGTTEHHRIYHEVIGHEEPLPPTKYQSLLR